MPTRRLTQSVISSPPPGEATTTATATAIPLPGEKESGVVTAHEHSDFNDAELSDDTYNSRDDHHHHQVQLFNFNAEVADVNITNANITGGGRPKRRLKVVARFDSTHFSNKPNQHNAVKAGHGFPCPRCGYACSYDSKQCEECELDCCYEAGIGVVVLKERRVAVDYKSNNGAMSPTVKKQAFQHNNKKANNANNNANNNNNNSSRTKTTTPNNNNNKNNNNKIQGVKAIDLLGNNNDPWTCECGEQYPGDRKRCGNCRKWRGGIRVNMMKKRSSRLAHTQIHTQTQQQQRPPPGTFEEIIAQQPIAAPMGWEDGNNNDDNVAAAAAALATSITQAASLNISGEQPTTTATRPKEAAEGSVPELSIGSKLPPPPPPPTHTLPKQKQRGASCGKCIPCLSEDCGKCRECFDKVKFGGRNVIKQRCSRRRCIGIGYPPPSPSSFRNPINNKHVLDTVVTLMGGGGERTANELIEGAESKEEWTTSSNNIAREEWECARCNTINKLAKLRCSSCVAWRGGHMPSFNGKKRDGLSLEEEEEEEEVGEEGGNNTWECTRCNTINKAAKSRCSSCKAWKGGIMPSFNGRKKRIGAHPAKRGRNTGGSSSIPQAPPPIKGPLNRGASGRIRGPLNRGSGPLLTKSTILPGSKRSWDCECGETYAWNRKRCSKAGCRKWRGGMRKGGIAILSRRVVYKPTQKRVSRARDNMDEDSVVSVSFSPDQDVASEPSPGDSSPESSHERKSPGRKRARKSSRPDASVDKEDEECTYASSLLLLNLRSRPSSDKLNAAAATESPAAASSATESVQIQLYEDDLHPADSNEGEDDADADADDAATKKKTSDDNKEEEACATISDLKKEITQLKDENNTQIAVNVELQAKEIALRQDRDELRQKVQTMTAQISVMQEESKKNSLELKIASEQKEIDELQIKHDRVNGQRGKLRVEIETTPTKVNAEHKAEIDTLKQQGLKRMSQVYELTDQLSAALNEKTVLSKKLEHVNDELSMMKIATASAQQEKIKSSNGGAEKEEAAKTVDVMLNSELLGQVERLTAKLNASKTKCDTLESSNEEYKEKMKWQSEKIQGLSDSVFTADETTTNLKAHIVTLTSERDELKKEVDMLNGL